MQFDVKNGDCYDRYHSPAGNAGVSADPGRTRRPLLGDAVAGPMTSSDGKVVPPKRGQMKRSMEALIHHRKLLADEGPVAVEA
ncbi:hypothetical protein [Rhizobium hidalgonense]|uniref:hypothetical protein n=1 Tax=Rhizobium hidalgonense TaxID=1538159 RepID=UPI0035C70847